MSLDLAERKPGEPAIDLPGIWLSAVPIDRAALGYSCRLYVINRGQGKRCAVGKATITFSLLRQSKAA